MASFSEIANDLDARARIFDRTHFKDHARAMRRGADAIRNLSDQLVEVSAAAEAETERLMAIVNGDDLRDG
jgi:hypothetical protein